jgi:hypothetical protein
VLVCELSVENLYYTCFHCAKQFKHVPTLLEHLRSHALKRFFCGLCDHKVQLPPTHWYEAVFWIRIRTAAAYSFLRSGFLDPDPVGSALFWRIRIRMHFNQMKS